MLRNYLKIALRNIRKHRAYALINILGLAIGMAATILIALFVQFELSFDKYHDKSERIYRLSREWIDETGSTALHLGHVAPPFGPLIQNDFGGIVAATTRITDGCGSLIEANGKKFEEERFYFGEQASFDIFSWDFLYGDPSSALVDPATVVITQSTAERYFGRSDVIGEMMIFRNYGMEVPMKITGVAFDIPENSHFTWDFMLSFASVEEAFGRENMMRNWGSNNYSTYVLLEEGHEISEMVDGMPAFLDKHMGTGPDGQLPSNTNIIHFWPLTDIHLHSHLDSEIGDNGDIAYIYLYVIIAVFTLLIACINFMNLSTAQSAQRGREVGVRKVMGAVKPALIGQFLTESIVFAVAGLVLAIALVVIVLPGFNEFFARNLSLNLSENISLVLILFGIIFFVGVVAGLYPAFYLTRFRPAMILKGISTRGTGGSNLRSVLVVVQFFISIVLIIGVGVVQDQLNFVRSKNLGFDKEHLILLPLTDEIFEKFADVKTRLENEPGISKVTLSSRVPSGRLLDSQGAKAEVNGEMKDVNLRIADVHVDHNYLSTFGIPIAAGRDFDHNRSSDSTEAFIINESAVMAIGWSGADEAIGKAFDYGDRSGQIIGVVSDFHFESLHQTIAPIVFMVTGGRANTVIVKYSASMKDEVLSFLQEQWTYFRPDNPFDYTEVATRFDAQYASEERLAKLISWVSILAVAIASLGLFGLATFVAERRTKELGIRKVMGASVWQLLVLLTRSFTILVLIAFLIAAPIAYFGMEEWLNGFAYRMQLGIWPFVMGGLLAIGVAWFTISWQTIRAARNNPVDSLRYE